MGKTLSAARRLSEELAQELRRAILDGSLPGGSRLVESKIAQEYGVSKTPVREALQILAAEGLVVQRPRRGAFVAEFSERDLEEIGGIRGVLEGYAARLVAARRDPAVLAHLERVIDEMEAADNQEALLELHLSFHRLLVESSGHRLLLEIWSNLEGRVRIFLAMTQAFYQDWRSIGQVHRPILEALRNGDADGAHDLVMRQAEPHLKALRDMRQGKRMKYLDRPEGS